MNNNDDFLGTILCGHCKEVIEYVPIDHVITFYGICSDCQVQSKKQDKLCETTFSN